MHGSFCDYSLWTNFIAINSRLHWGDNRNKVHAKKIVASIDKVNWHPSILTVTGIITLKLESRYKYIIKAYPLPGGRKSVTYLSPCLLKLGLISVWNLKMTFVNIIIDTKLSQLICPCVEVFIPSIGNKLLFSQGTLKMRLRDKYWRSGC